MAQKFLYRFGYCTPLQWAANDTHGWDDESSGAVVIKADSAQDALRWGREVAAAFVARLFDQSGRTEPTRWPEADFANWIEENPTKVFSEEQLAAVPVVAFGEIPDFTAWQANNK